MMFNVRYEERPGYLYANITGEAASEETFGDCLGEIVKKCDELKCERLLIENEVRSIPVLQSLYKVAKTLYKLNGTRKTAFVNKYGWNYGKTDFMFLAYRSLGGDGEVYGRTSLAEQWLFRKAESRALPDGQMIEYSDAA